MRSPQDSEYGNQNPVIIKKRPLHKNRNGGKVEYEAMLSIICR